MSAPNYEQMRRAAVAQATDRARRERQPMYIFEHHGTWYVRANSEGEPDGADFVEVVLEPLD